VLNENTEEAGRALPMADSNAKKSLCLIIFIEISQLDPAKGLAHG
jgi:hypothetical protein